MYSPDVLVLGGPGAGKTHYAGQLLGRLRHDAQGSLRLRPGGAESLLPLEEVLSCLEEGRSAGHTPAQTWADMKLHLDTKPGQEVLVEWPDYAGEQIDSMVQSRVLSSRWRQSVTAARAWMLFIRPATLKRHEDLLSRPTGLRPDHAATSPSGTDVRWDDSAHYVELLQMLLFTVGHSTYGQIHRPRLAVMLSCWDELNGAGIPDEMLRERLPLLHSFIETTWTSKAWSVWGLSSLSRRLLADSPDPEFVADGPEKFGYVIRPGTDERDPDLTLPVAWLLEV